METVAAAAQDSRHQVINWITVEQLVEAMIERHDGQLKDLRGVYGIPRGGSVVALSVSHRTGLPILDQPRPYSFIVDDLVDTGRTMQRYATRETCVCDALIRKPHSPSHFAPNALKYTGWVVFPWEANEAPAEDAVVRLIQSLGENPMRDGLLDTPKRVVKAMQELTTGYAQDPKMILGRVFEADYDQMVLVKGIDFTSLCEHHLMPFTGTATVGYVPGKSRKIVGVSKLVRLVDCFARRLQIQERMTQQIAMTIMETLQPLGAGCVVVAKHACMGCRGVRRPGAAMVTSAMYGLFREDSKARAEMLALSNHP